MGEIYIIKNYVFPELFYIGKAKNGPEATQGRNERKAT